MVEGWLLVPSGRARGWPLPQPVAPIVHGALRGLAGAMHEAWRRPRGRQQKGGRDGSAVARPLARAAPRPRATPSGGGAGIIRVASGLGGLVVLEDVETGDVQLRWVIRAAKGAVDHLELDVAELLFDFLVERRARRKQAGHSCVSLWWAATRRLTRLRAARCPGPTARGGSPLPAFRPAPP